MDRVGSISALAAAISHEINQPLAAILSNAQAGLRFLADEQPDLDEVREALRDIATDDKRAGEVIRRLRMMLKKEEHNRESFDPNSVIEEALDLVRSEVILRNVSLEKDLEPGLGAVHGDPIQIQQVVLNLLMNALDAVQEQPVDVRDVIISSRWEGDDRITVCVRDSGTGIDPGKLEAIFDPFYTTKHKGLGLVLSLCRAIIEAHGGKLWAENQPDGGATFYFTVPIARGKMITPIEKTIDT